MCTSTGPGVRSISDIRFFTKKKISILFVSTGEIRHRAVRITSGVYKAVMWIRIRVHLGLTLKSS